MKKIAKLSLVAAVAVAGLSTASASSLEEAIKGVDVSGMVRYRYNEEKVDKGDSSRTNDYDIELTAKVPVNDMLKAVVKFDFAYDYDPATQADGKRKALDIEDAYFSYTNSGFVVNAGKQNIPGPMSDGINGTGIVAMAPVGPVTLAGGYFNSNELTPKDAYELAILASFQNINFDIWYADVRSVLEAYSVGANGTFGPLSVDARYGERDEDTNDNEYSVGKINVSAEFGMFDVHGGFAITGEDNAGVGAAIDKSNDSEANNFQLEQLEAGTAMSDGKAWIIGASVSPIDKLTVGLDYMGGTADKIKYIGTHKDADYTEVTASAAYKMSKNFKISTFYSVATIEPDGKDDIDNNSGRLELKYSF